MPHDPLRTLLPSILPVDLENFLFNHLPGLFFLGVILGSLTGLLIGGVELALAGLLITGIPFLVASFYLMLRNDVSTYPIIRNVPKSVTSIRTFSIAYLVGISYLAIVPDRGYEFFILLTGMFLLAFLSTFQHYPERGIGYAIATLLISTYSVTLREPLFIGGTDILPHLSYTLHIVNTGTVIPDWVSNYANFPLYHIFGAIFIQISGRLPEKSYFIIIGAVVATTPLLIYGISSRITKNRRLSCQVSIVYATLPTVVYAGLYSITRTFAFIGFLLLLWIFLVENRYQNWAWSILLGVSVLFTLLVHQVSYLQILFVLVLLWGVSKAMTSGRPLITVFEILFFVTPFCAYWIYNAEGLIGRLIVRQVLGTSATPTSGGIDTSLPIFHIFEYLNTYLLGLFLLVGIVISFRSNNERIRIVALFTLICTPFIMYSPIHVINRLSAFRLDRLILLLSLFTALFVTLGMKDIIDQLSGIKYNYSMYFIVVLFSIFAFTSLLGGIYQDTAADSNKIGWQGPTEHLEAEEQAALEHTLLIPSGRQIRTDGISYKYLTSRLPMGEFTERQQTLYDIKTIRNPNDVMGEYLIRHEAREKRGELVLGYYGGDYIYEGTLNIGEHDRVYTSGDSAILHRVNASSMGKPASTTQ
ncbi:hypothetical protein HZS55_06110 [Halosimplex rubrum]|uniref:Uncharacterized protein n=1 Tax=Halosimplex rubrum TaxID=869889 RepID=A0A7D5P8E5_9EURY|nr:hypothetical protein [Halosimplex rubrum]QLH76900.1 hypothetical protein HZS55_06110 [Halosimplex rubrum]